MFYVVLIMQGIEMGMCLCCTYHTRYRDGDVFYVVLIMQGIEMGMCFML